MLMIQRTHYHWKSVAKKQAHVLRLGPEGFLRIIKKGV